VLYFETDHLGSVRSVIDNAGDVVTTNDYYPFGTRHSGVDIEVDDNFRYRFNGKEEQLTGNIGLLDYGARMYDSEIGRWSVPDPLAEKYYSLSPYDFVGGNPINRIDPNGMDWYSYNEEVDEVDEYGNPTGNKKNETRYKYVRGEMSSKEMKEGGYTHLGKIHADNGVYYSLFGDQFHYDMNDYSQVSAVSDILMADKIVIAGTQAWSSVMKFWDSMGDLLSSGTAFGGIAAEYSSSFSFGTTMKGLSYVGLGLEASSLAKSLMNQTFTIQKGADLVFSAIGTVGVPGAIVNLGYISAKTMVNTGAKTLTKAEFALRGYFKDWFKQGFGNMGIPVYFGN